MTSSRNPRSFTHGQAYALPSPPKVGAVCLNRARTDLSGGRGVTCVPTAIRIDRFAPGDDNARKISVSNAHHMPCTGDCCAAKGARRSGLLRVKSSPADYVVYTAEGPPKADRIAAATRTENECHKRL